MLGITEDEKWVKDRELWKQYYNVVTTIQHWAIDTIKMLWYKMYLNTSYTNLSYLRYKITN